MKKKLLTVMLAFVMTVAFMPAMTFASTVGSTTDTGKATTGTRAPSRLVIRNVTNSVENTRQQVLDLLNQSYDESVLSENRYSPMVWQGINEIYQNEVDRINAATDINDLITIVEILGIAVPSDKTMNAISQIQSLSEKTVQNVPNGAAYLKKLKASLYKRALKKEGKYNKARYNSYYWDLFLDKKDEINSQISSVSSYADYEAANTAYDNAFGEGAEATEGIGDFKGNEVDISWLMTKDAMSKGVIIGTNVLNYFVSKDLPAMGYKGDKDEEVDAVAKKYLDTISNAKDFDTIRSAIEEVGSDIIDVAGVSDTTYKHATLSVKTRMAKKLEDIYYSYRTADYSDAGWMKIETIYQSYTDDLNYYVISESQVTGMDKRMKAKMDKVPTYKEELKSAKTKAIRTLTKLKTASKGKWYHSKVVKIANQGIAKIKKCTTLGKVRTTLSLYKAKIAKAKK